MLNQRRRSGNCDWTIVVALSARAANLTSVWRKCRAHSPYQHSRAISTAEELPDHQKSSLLQSVQIGFGKMKRMAPLTIEERIEGPDRMVLLRGSADILCLSAIQALFGRYSKEKIRLLLVDLSATEFINSPVWAVVTLYARKKAGECRVAIVGMPDRIKGSFEMMGLHKELETFPTAEIARRELGF